MEQCRARPLLSPVKRPVTIRLDADVIDWFRLREPKYQTAINRVLRAHMEGKGGPGSAGIRPKAAALNARPCRRVRFFAIQPSHLRLPPILCLTQGFHSKGVSLRRVSVHRGCRRDEHGYWQLIVDSLPLPASSHGAGDSRADESM